MGGRARVHDDAMRCDANEICRGNTGLCISRCALWNRNRVFTFRSLFILVLRFFFVPFLSVCLFVPIWVKNQKRARTSITCIHHHHHHTGRGWETGRAGATCALFLVIWEYRGNSPLTSRFPFIPTLVCLCLLPTIPDPCFFSRQRTPTHPLPKAPGGYTLLTPSSLPCQTRSPDTPGRRGEGSRVFFIRVVRERRG
ncbi:hypothetical protein F5883DRAFT_217904 [Diaporthe sp. PMI_573]|nr:hypothetical protein F5883DRAFT_217904 [Diaporthaceae sp. PMI_573]